MANATLDDDQAFGNKATFPLKLWVSDHSRDQLRPILILVGSKEAPARGTAATATDKARPGGPDAKGWGGMLLLSLDPAWWSWLNCERVSRRYPMDTPLPDAGEKRARAGRWKRFVRDVLLRPTTWRAAAAALDFGLKLVRVGAKVWELLG